MKSFGWSFDVDKTHHGRCNRMGKQIDFDFADRCALTLRNCDLITRLQLNQTAFSVSQVSHSQEINHKCEMFHSSSSEK